MKKFFCLLAFITFLCIGIAPYALGEAVYDKAVTADSYALTVQRSGRDNKLAWKPIPSAAKYEIYYSTKPDGQYKRLTTVVKPGYTHKKAAEAAFYKVRALIGKKKKNYSEIVGTVVPVKSVSTQVTGDKLQLKWTKVPYTTGYTIQKSKRSGGPWTTVKENSASTTFRETLKDTSCAYYRVLSTYKTFTAASSPVTPVFNPINSVNVVCKENYSTGPSDDLLIQWAPSHGATAYEIYRATLPSNTLKKIATTAANVNVYQAKRKPLTAHAYAVRPIYGDQAGAISPASTLWSGMPENIPAPKNAASSTGVVLVVNKGAQVVTAYVKDSNGKYTVPLRHMICSTGKVDMRTPEGAFQLSKRQQWYRYPSGTYIRYPVTYKSGLYFHSVLYTSGKSIMGSTVGRLGTRQSLGCIRLKVSDAKWVYDYCTSGTKVYIESGKKIPALTDSLKPKNISK